MILPGQNLAKGLPKKVLEGLGVEISLIIDDLEQQYQPLFKDIATWWKNYEAIPKNPGAKNYPFKGASNVVVPVIRIMVDAAVNRAYGTIHGHGRRIWSASTENEDFERPVKDVGRWINHAGSNNDFNMRLTAYDWLLEMHALGSSVVGLNWRRDDRWVYAPTRGSRTLQPVRVHFARGAFPQHIPRENILWDTNFLIQEAPAVVREHTYTWSQLRNFSDLDDSWLREAIESIRGKGEPQGPSQAVKREKEGQDSKNPNDPATLRHTHDVREVYLDWPMLNSMGWEGQDIATPGEEKFGTPSPPIVVTLDRNTKTILRLIAQPYNLPYKPFFDIFYRKRSGRGHSVGIGKKLEHMQVAMTTSLNQALDARTRANSIWATTNRKDFLSTEIDPAHPIYRPNEGAFEPLNLSTAIFDDMRLGTFIWTLAERDTGQSDPALGRETRQGGHPSPATSTLALLEQSNLMSGTTKELVRLQYSRLGEAIAALYQQFETNEDGRLERVLGVGDAAQVQKFIFPTDPMFGNITFDMVAYSENFNPDTEMKRAVLVSQMNTNYWAFVLRVMQSIAQIPQMQAPPQLQAAMLQGAVQSIKGQTKAHLRFLEAGDVDDLEQFVLQLERGEQQSSADIRAATGGLAEIAGNRLGVQGAPMGEAGGMVPGGAAGSLGALG
jgi:hypothetical protein